LVAIPHSQERSEHRAGWKDPGRRYAVAKAPPSDPGEGRADPPAGKPVKPARSAPGKRSRSPPGRQCGTGAATSACICPRCPQSPPWSAATGPSPAGLAWPGRAKPESGDLCSPCPTGASTRLAPGFGIDLLVLRATGGISEHGGEPSARVPHERCRQRDGRARQLPSVTVRRQQSAARKATHANDHQRGPPIPSSWNAAVRTSDSAAGNTAPTCGLARSRENWPLAWPHR